MDQKGDIAVLGVLRREPRLAAVLDSDVEDGPERPRLAAVLESVADCDRGAAVPGERDLFEPEDPEEDEEVPTLLA
jgi:hypothetical protein